MLVGSKPKVLCGLCQVAVPYEGSLWSWPAAAGDPPGVQIAVEEK